MEDDDLLRVEGAVTATASGDLTWTHWTHDMATALGFAGRRNPLGFAVVRYLNDEPSSIRVWDVLLHLVTELLKRGIAKEEVHEVARKAFDFWRDMRCTTCHGRGITGAGIACSPCGGSGQRKVPESPESLYTAVSCLIEAEQWMDRQLRSRLKK